VYQPGRRSRGRPRANLPFTNPSGRSTKPAGAHRRWRSRRCARPDATPPITRRNAFSCKQLAEKLRVSPDCLVLETVTRIIESWVTPFSHPLRGHRVASTVSRLSDRGPLFGHSSSPFPRSIWPRLAAKAGGGDSKYESDVVANPNNPPAHSRMGIADSLIDHCLRSSPRAGRGLRRVSRYAPEIAVASPCGRKAKLLLMRTFSKNLRAGGLRSAMGSARPNGRRAGEDPQLSTSMHPPRRRLAALDDTQHMYAPGQYAAGKFFEALSRR